MKHTKGPWKYEKELSARSGEWLISVDAGACWRGNPIAETRPATGDEAANARRIVACVNACEGIPTEKLDEIAHCIGMRTDVLIEQLKQRDELAKAMQLIATTPGSAAHHRIAQQVLEKVKPT